MKQRSRLYGVLLAIALAFTTKANASGWEQIMVNPNTYAHFITSNGVQLVSDYSDFRDVGIYCSVDGGVVWEDCGVEDNWYSKFYETEEFIIL